MGACGVPCDTQVLGSKCEADLSPVPPPRPRPQLSHETPLPRPTAPQMLAPRGPLPSSASLTSAFPRSPEPQTQEPPTASCRVSREKPDAAFGRRGRCALIGSPRPRGQRLGRSASAGPASKETAEGDWLQGAGRRDTLLPDSILLAGQFGAKLTRRKRRGGAQRWRRGGLCCVLVLSLFQEEVTSFQPRAEEAIGP